jgi:hypothetical protein
VEKRKCSTLAGNRSLVHNLIEGRKRKGRNRGGRILRRIERMKRDKKGQKEERKKCKRKKSK